MCEEELREEPTALVGVSTWTHGLLIPQGCWLLFMFPFIMSNAYSTTPTHDT